MATKVKLEFNRLQWAAMSKLMEDTTLICPVEDWSLETYIIADLFMKKMAFWKIYPYSRKGNKIKISLTMVQAIAMNSYFGATSEAYNKLVRIQLEPQLVLNVHQKNEEHES